MTQVAHIAIDNAQYDDRFRKILEETGLEPHEFEGLEYFSYAPFFVLAGATVTPNIRLHGDHTHFEGVTMTVPDELLEAFYDVLPDLLAQLIEDDAEHGHDHE